MKKIQVLALLSALIAVAIYVLMQLQAASSAAPVGGVVLFAALIALPLLVASAVFSVGSTFVLKTRVQRIEHGFTNLFWYLVLLCNLILSGFYLYVLISFVYSFIFR